MIWRWNSMMMRMRMTKSAPQATDKVLPPWDGLRDLPGPRFQVQKNLFRCKRWDCARFWLELNLEIITAVTSRIETITFIKTMEGTPSVDFCPNMQLKPLYQSSWCRRQRLRGLPRVHHGEQPFFIFINLIFFIFFRWTTWSAPGLRGKSSAGLLKCPSIVISLDKHVGQGFSKCDLKNKLRFDADHSGEIDHEETIGIIECILDGKVTPETFRCIVINIFNLITNT